MISSARRRARLGADTCVSPPAPGHHVGRAISPAAEPCGGAGLPGQCEHRPLRNTRQGPARLRRTPPPQGGNAPLRLRLAAHPPPLAGEAFGRLPSERLPCKGLQSRAPPAAEKLFLIRQTAVTPFIIACSAIESIGPPFAHRSGLCRFAATQRSQNASVLQHTQRDAGTASR